MVMTIPYINKIKVLTKICPPLAPSSPKSPAQGIRGAVIAIEGPDKALLAETGAFITESLTNGPSCAVKTWGVSEYLKPVEPLTTDTEMTDATAAPHPPSTLDEKDPFVEYLSIISDMHLKSHSIIKYITTSQEAEATSPKTKIIPVALVPAGFSLTTSDTFALRIPINDSYAPIDHWQWMATLWRGIVGPDLTVYVTRVGRDEMNKYGGVEIRVDCGAIIVRVPEGGGSMDEKTARRLGFEVLEFVRGAEAGFGRR